MGSRAARQINTTTNQTARSLRFACVRYLRPTSLVGKRLLLLLTYPAWTPRLAERWLTVWSLVLALHCAARPTNPVRAGTSQATTLDCLRHLRLFLPGPLLHYTTSLHGPLVPVLSLHSRPEVSAPADVTFRPVKPAARSVITSPPAGALSSCPTAQTFHAASFRSNLWAPTSLVSNTQLHLSFTPPSATSFSLADHRHP